MKKISTVPAKLHVRRGDKVRLIAGNDRGKEGRVLRVYPKLQRVVVEGCRMVKRHRKPDANHPSGQIEEKEAPIHVSNLMLLDPGTEHLPVSVAGAMINKNYSDMPKKQISSSPQLPRLQQKYYADIVPQLQKVLGFRSPMRVPRLEKVVINRGIGAAVADKKLLEAGIEELTRIAGQRAVPTRAKKSISNFKLREGMPIGARVTLRKQRMYEFVDRLISVALPRVRDFQGISAQSFDSWGNYTLGIREQIVFPEISIDKISRLSGMDITFVTTARDKDEGLALLTALGLPFKKT